MEELFTITLIKTKKKQRKSHI